MNDNSELIARADLAYEEWYDSVPEEAYEDSLSFDFVREIAQDLIRALERADKTIARLRAGKSA